MLYFDLLLPELRQLFCHHHVDPQYYGPLRRLPGFQFLVPNYCYDEIIHYAVQGRYTDLIRWLYREYVFTFHTIADSCILAAESKHWDQLYALVNCIVSTPNYKNKLLTIRWPDSVVSAPEMWPVVQLLLQYDNLTHILPFMPLLLLTQQRDLLIPLFAHKRWNSLSFKPLVRAMCSCQSLDLLAATMTFITFTKSIETTERVKILTSTIKYGNIEGLKLLLDQFKLPLDDKVLAKAIKLEKDDIIELLLQRECPCGRATIKQLVFSYQIPLLRKLLGSNFTGAVSHILLAAAECGNLPMILAIARSHKRELRSNLARMAEAASNARQLAVLQYCHKRGCRLNSAIFSNAISSNDLVMVQWLHQQNCPTDDVYEVFDIKMMPILRWLIETYPNANSMINFDDSPYMEQELCYFLYQHGLPKDRTYDYNLLPQLALHDEPPPANFILYDGLYHDMINIGDLKVIDWCIKHDVPVNNRSSLVSDAVRKGRLTLVKYLTANLTEFHRIWYREAREVGAYDTAEWLKSEGQRRAELAKSKQQLSALEDQKSLITDLDTLPHMTYEDEAIASRQKRQRL